MRDMSSPVARFPRLNPFQSLRHIPGQPITYLRNPKVASKSIELSLWRAYDPDGAPENPHAVRTGPFFRNARQLTDESLEAFLASEFFSVVRNPYARFLSGYLNKVLGRGTGEKMRSRFGLPPDSTQSIEEFLAAVKGMKADALDPHFRPQHLNLLHGLVSLDFVGHLEDMKEVAAFLGRHGFAIVSNKRNATGATDRVRELLSPRAVEVIQDIYEKDFEIYGYSTNPATVEPMRCLRVAGRDRSALRDLLVRQMEARRERSLMPAKMPVSPGKASEDIVAQGSTSMAGRLFRPMRHNNPFQRIRHIPGQGITYLQNPKVACTSIELTLWGAYAGPETPKNPHSVKVRPYIKDMRKASSKDIESLLASTFFSVVRNPYARFLSAYYDKVGADKRPWERIGGSLGFAKDTTPSLSELLIALQARDPVDVDHHFRPQHLNLLCGFAPLDFLGYMEQMDSVTAFLAKHGYALVRYTGNATGAAAKMSMLSARDAELIRHYYAKDFELFGYDDDPGRKEPVRATTTLDPKRGRLRRFIMKRSAPSETDKAGDKDEPPLPRRMAR